MLRTTLLSIIAAATVALVVAASPLATPCPTEDSTNCYWDAAARGNGQGTSYVSIAGVTFSLGS